MKIFDIEGFPNPARVRIALAEKGATDKVEFVSIDVMNEEHRTNAFKAINPDASVPCAQLDDGTYISQVTAITEYIDGTFEGPSLFGKTPKDRAVIHMMNRRAENGLVDAVGAYFHFATDGLSPELETYQNSDWGLRQREVATQTMAYLDRVLSTSDFLAGDQFSMADITAFAGLAFADFAKVDIPENLHNLIKWLAQMAQRPSIAV